MILSEMLRFEMFYFFSFFLNCFISIFVFKRFVLICFIDYFVEEMLNL